MIGVAGTSPAVTIGENVEALKRASSHSLAPDRYFFVCWTLK